MKKQLLLVLALSAMSVPALEAQIALTQDKKWDIQTGSLIQTYELSRATRGAAADKTAGFIIATTDGHAVADSIRAAGGEATVLNGNMVSATMPVSSLSKIAKIEAVERINASRKFQPTLEVSRELTNVTPIHDGTELETPFTGKGVIIGVIDQGFQYKHVAFLDKEGNSRTLYVWNRTQKGSKPTDKIPTGHDLMYSSHATHVTNIAAGSRINGNNYYGMAPEADIIMVPSDFADNEVIEDVQWIKSVAQEQGKPWVVNMSFGSQIGPHDGSTDYDQTISSYCGPGGLIAGAMGNEGGQKLHINFTLANKGDKKTVLISNSDGTENYESNFADFWGTATDGKQHFKVTPFYCTVSGVKTTRVDKEETFWANVGSVGGEVSPNNQKEHYQIYIHLASLANRAGVDIEKVLFGLEFEALDDNAEMHGWINPGYGEFIKKSSYGINGDSEYLVGEGAASIPEAIAVASYNGASNFVSAATGQALQYPGLTSTGAISSFSSPGPWLGDLPKPTITAPGATISSAVNRFTVSKDDVTLVGAVDSKGEEVKFSSASTSRHDFYGVMNGTSMATPAVSGILALWLQANPSLTPADVREILKETAIKDRQTGTALEWSEKSGYGKIDAYEGLKKALEKAESNGIAPMISNEKPVTLMKNADEWRILFNTAEQHATISLTTLNGKVLLTQHLGGVAPGHETAMSLQDLTPGIYVIRIATPNTTVARKVVVAR